MDDAPHPWLDHYPDGVDWHAPLPSAPLTKLLDDAAALFPNQPAWQFFGRRTSFADACRQVDRLAAGLQRLGLQKGDRLGLMLPNCPAYPLLFFAGLRAGLTIVNFNPLYTPRELEHQARDAECAAMATLDLASMYPKAATLLQNGAIGRLIVCPFADMLPAAKRALFNVVKRRQRSNVRWDRRHSAFDDLETDGAPLVPVEIDPARDIAVLQYTGGTSGTPKGAMLSHANLYANATQGVLWFKDTRPGQERTLAALPFFHVFAMTTVLLFGVHAAAEIIMLPRWDLRQAVRTIARRKPTYFSGVPTLFNAIASYPGKADMTSIRFCISGGAPLPQEVKHRFEARTGCVVVEGYGLSETSPCVICNPPGGRNKPGIGLPMPQTIAELRDPSDPARAVPQGERGEVCLKGPQVMLGYWRRPEETEAATTPDGFFRTGDIGVMDEEGYFQIVDRIKDVILAGGYNVYPRNVEEAVYEHPAVLECTVIGIPHAYRGETVKAFIALKPGATLTQAELLGFLAERLSPIELPKQVEFRASLPRTLIGKLSKKELVAEEAAKRAAD